MAYVFFFSFLLSFLTWALTGQHRKGSEHPCFLIPLCDFQPNTNIEPLLFSEVSEIPTLFLNVNAVLDEIYSPLKISIWLNFNYKKLVDVMIDVANFSLPSCGFELSSNIILVLETHQSTNHKYCIPLTNRVSLRYWNEFS